MATAVPYSSQSHERTNTLNKFQAITGLNIEDAIHFLDQYDWKLEDIIRAYRNEKQWKENSHDHPNLDRFYSMNDDERKSSNEYSSFYGHDNEYCREKEIEPIYHEKQRLMKCGLHSLNNLFQIPKLFTTQHLETIVREYDKRTFFNDYRTLWFGNYDLRILIQVINRCGFDVRQIDFYHGESLHFLPWDTYFGLLINLNGDHWFTIKNLQGIYHNLDSTLRKPVRIGDEEQLIRYLIHLIQRTTRVYLFVVTKQRN